MNNDSAQYLNLPKYSKISLILAVLLIVHWSLAWYWVPVDVLQGEVYRIIYLHVPSAFASFLCAGILLIGSLFTFKNPNESKFVALSKASTEVGLIFTIITLATGSIWGKPTWGTWWTWDARLTTTLLLCLLYIGWLLLYSSLEAGASRNRSCAILGVLIAADVPIIYKSVTWWRTLHQPQTILRPGGSATMDPEMLTLLLSGVFLMVMVSVWLILERQKNILLENELRERSLQGES